MESCAEAVSSSPTLGWAPGQGASLLRPRERSHRPCGRAAAGGWPWRQGTCFKLSVLCRSRLSGFLLCTAPLSKIQQDCRWAECPSEVLLRGDGHILALGNGCGELSSTASPQGPAAETFPLERDSPGVTWHLSREDGSGLAGSHLASS